MWEGASDIASCPPGVHQVFSIKKTFANVVAVSSSSWRDFMTLCSLQTLNDHQIWPPEPCMHLCCSQLISTDLQSLGSALWFVVARLGALCFSSKHYLHPILVISKDDFLIINLENWSPEIFMSEAFQSRSGNWSLCAASSNQQVSFQPNNYRCLRSTACSLNVLYCHIQKVPQCR